MKYIKKVQNLVLGGNLKALEFAFREGFPIFYPNLEAPFHLEQTKEGMNKKNIIQNYAFLLSCSGLNYSSNFVGEYRLEDKCLIVTGKKPWSIEIHFETLHNFMIEEENDNNVYKIVDYINVRSCGSHNIRELRTEDPFVKEIYFYPSKRANSSKNFSLSTHNYETTVKDVIVVSYLTKQQAQQEEHSPIYSRLKLKEIMEQTGIQGKKRGKRANGKIIRSSIQLEFAKREILEIEEHQRNYYYFKSKNDYLNRLLGHLYGRND